jgi:type IV pilus assembly protein PilO
MTRLMPLRDMPDRFPALLAGLDPSDPASWAAWSRLLLLLVAGGGTVALLWVFWLSGLSDSLLAEQARETRLKRDFQHKVRQVGHLQALRQQLDQLQQTVNELQRQLPSQAEMDALLSDINRAGLGRRLQFELFRPGEPSVHEHHGERPVALRVTGSYHDLGLFTADIAHLPRTVTLGKLSLKPARDRPGLLTLEGTVKTVWTLDPVQQARRPGDTGGKP